MSERLYSTDAIVVRRRDQGEADRVLTLCTPRGKLSVIARGVRKLRSRKAGHLELFTHARLTIARSRSSWDVVSQAETVQPHAPLRGDLLRGSYARYVVELYDRFIADEEGSPALFDLLERTLTYLDGEERLDLLTRAYEQRLLTLVGFRPEWERCVGERDGHPCEQVPQPGGDEPFGLDPERGGVLCRRCYQADRGGRGVIPLSPPALALLRACGQEPFARLREQRVAPAVLAEAERAMRHYIAYHLEREVRSETFLRRLRRENDKTGHGCTQMHTDSE